MVKKTSEKDEKEKSDFPQYIPNDDDDNQGTSRDAAAAVPQSQSKKRHSKKKHHHYDDDDVKQKKKKAVGRPKEDSNYDFPQYMPDDSAAELAAPQPHSTERQSKKKHHHHHEYDDDMNQKKKAAVGRPKDDSSDVIPADTAIPFDDQLKEDEKKSKRAAETSGVARRAPQSMMERVKGNGSAKSIPGEDDIMQEVEDNGEAPPSSSAPRVRRPRPPVRDVTPGAFAVDGVDGPAVPGTDIDDDTYYIGESYPSYTPATTSQALEAHLAAEDEKDDRDIIEGIENQEDENLDVVEAILSDGDKTFWQKRSTRVGLVIVLVIVIVGVVTGAVVASRDTDGGPEPIPSNETVSPAPTLMPSASPSMSPTTADFTGLVAFLANASLDDGAALQVSTSPQYRAAQWLYNNENLSEYADSQRIQRYALAVLYYSTNGQNWLQKTDWMSDELECDWFNKGVTFCDAVSNGVANLDLNENNLVGALPPELYMLAGSVTSLIFSGNTLSGQIPTELGLLTKLTSLNNFGLNLNGNEIVGTIPSELGRLRGAGVFDLGANNITGPIVSELGSLRATTKLNLGTNELVGAIPPEIYGIPSLSELSLAGNSFTGTIDTTVGLMANLVDLNMGNNKLEGPIPSEVGSLVRLQSLKLENNQLTSTVPSEVSQLTRLGTLWLYENELTGPYTCPARDEISDCRVSCGSSNDDCRTLE